MWDVGCLTCCGMLIYKMPFIKTYLINRNVFYTASKINTKCNVFIFSYIRIEINQTI